MVMAKQGSIVLVAGGAYSSKPRPVVVIQNHDIKTGESVIVIPFTSMDNAEISTRIPVIPSKKNGLDRNCFLEVDKISAINSSYIGDYVGTLEHSTLKDVQAMIFRLLG
jgi:mRNA-degrading endonuclease toxin of MazEF toxin-antitoxin module